jgi:hypothetical protein
MGQTRTVSAKQKYGSLAPGAPSRSATTPAPPATSAASSTTSQSGVGPTGHRPWFCTAATFPASPHPCPKLCHPTSTEHSWPPFINSTMSRPGLGSSPICGSESRSHNRHPHARETVHGQQGGLKSCESRLTGAVNSNQRRLGRCSPCALPQGSWRDCHLYHWFREPAPPTVQRIAAGRAPSGVHHCGQQ